MATHSCTPAAYSANTIAVYHARLKTPLARLLRLWQVCARERKMERTVSRAVRIDKTSWINTLADRSDQAWQNHDHREVWKNARLIAGLPARS
eukprot:12137551-Heterocapsa_arctica.AAC.1